MYKIKTDLGNISRAGILENEKLIIDINFVWQVYYEKQDVYSPEVKSNILTPASVSNIIKLNQEPIEVLQKTLELYKKYSKEGILKTKNNWSLAYHIHDFKNIDFDVPLDDINSYRDFYIHEKHVKKGFEKRNEAMPEAWYEMPVYYKGPRTSFIGNNEIVPWPSYTKKLDYELELAAVIGKDGKNIKEKDAMKHIFGFTILNDISARDIQKKEMSVRLGPSKGKDFCSIIGPVIVTADEFKYKEPDLEMRAIINDELWSKGRSSEGHFTWSQMIEHASRDEWLIATDILGSGTVGTGCGLELDKWIKPGDKVTLEIEKIGSLTNIIGTPNE